MGHGGVLAVIACSSALDRAELARPLTEGGFRTLVTADGPTLLEEVLASEPDVMIIDLELALAYVDSVAGMVAEHPGLANLPVLLVLPEGGVGPLPPDIAPYVTDVVFRPVGAVELLVRTQSVLTRRRRQLAQRDAAALIRGQMRRISAGIKATNDPDVMTERFLSGVGAALGARHAALQIFDDDRVSARSSSWSTTPAEPGTAPLSPPRRDHRPEDLELALDLWEGSSVAGFGSGVLGGGATRSGGVRATDTRPVPGAVQASVAVPEWLTETLGIDTMMSGVALALGEGDTPFGLLWVVFEGLPAWSGVEASLTQHVLGNLAHGLIQAQLISRQQQAVRKLRALNQAKTDFVGSVNHELRTPLASITGYLEMILDGIGGELPTEARTMLQAVERNTAKLNELVENISSLSVQQTDESEYGPVDFVHLVSDLVRALTAEAADRDIQLTCSLPAGPVVVAGNREELAAALGIILSNALKFTTAAGEVAVGLSVDEAADAVTLEISDTGIGIPPDDLPRLFDAFQRAANTQQVLPGAGVGLAVAHRTMQAHRGTIGITSELGVGTTVVITLPLLDHVAVGHPDSPWTETP